MTRITGGFHDFGGHRLGLPVMTSRSWPIGLHHGLTAPAAMTVGEKCAGRAERDVLTLLDICDYYLVFDTFFYLRPDY